MCNLIAAKIFSNVRYLLRISVSGEGSVISSLAVSQVEVKTEYTLYQIL